MGQGVTFFDGLDAPSVNPTPTVPSEPATSAGPVQFYAGSEPTSANGDTLPSGEGKPGGIGGAFVSPTDA